MICPLIKRILHGVNQNITIYGALLLYQPDSFSDILSTNGNEDSSCSTFASPFPLLFITDIFFQQGNG